MTTERRIAAAAGLVVAAYVALQVPHLGDLQHVVDEGVNVYAARLMEAGLKPLRDIAYQQPPLYLYALLVGSTDDLMFGRGLSLLATALTGLLVFLLARRTFGPTSWLPVLVTTFFCFAGMQVWSLLAMPGACMLLFGVLAIWVSLRWPEGVWPGLAAGALLAVSVLFKPLTLALYVALAVALLTDRAGRRRLIPLTLGATVVGLASWWLWDQLTSGAFSDMVWMQRDRTAQGDLLESFRQLPAFRAAMEGMTRASFSWRLYRSAFGVLAPDGAHADWLLALIALLGLGAAWRRDSGLPLREQLLWSAWLVIPVLFDFFVWPLAYEHYHLILLPPVAVLASLWLRRFVVAGRARRAWGAAIFVCVWLNASLDSTRGRIRDYGPVLALRGQTAPLMAFDPTINVLSGAPVPCGATHWQLPPYGRDSQSAPYEIGRDHLIRCLDATPEAKVVIHDLSPLAQTLIDRKLQTFITGLPTERVVYLSPLARASFEAIAAAPAVTQ